MRVIAGTAGGRPLKAPPEGLRPTMDRVRAAVFSSLGDLVPNARVLDLFAGSGGYGIEALSRGAQSALFVDENEKCCRCIKENLRMAGFDARVQTMCATRFIDLYAEAASFDLIFADPPYAKNEGVEDHASNLLKSSKLAESLAPGGLLILERHIGAKTPHDAVFEIIKSRKYGGTEILFLNVR